MNTEACSQDSLRLYAHNQVGSLKPEQMNYELRITNYELPNTQFTNVRTPKPVAPELL
jgi:hypothetical protein